MKCGLVIPIGSLGLVYLPTFTKKISQIHVNMPYIDPMGYNDPLKIMIPNTPCFPL